MVDAANVVGSVPDGWWRDRAGAAGRLADRLAAALAAGRLPFDEVVVVVEGRARPGVPSGRVGSLESVHAPASGDDEIVVRCRAHAATGAAVTLASADRGLLARVAPLGVETLGPRTLRDRLD